ncbi:Wide host range VirA protein [bacterium BMS3Abin03]|nr:Wide host range VirA protein [bacterium BMS3Abin03]
MPTAEKSKYAFDDVLEVQNAPLAIADTRGKIIWYNNSFKKNFKQGRIKGYSVPKLFALNEDEYLSKLNSHNSFVHPLPEANKNLIISPLYSKDKKRKLNGYFIELVPTNLNDTESEKDKDIVERNIEFLSALKNLLVLLVKENSLDDISREIISKAISISKSDFGFIVFHNENNSYEFLFDDPEEHIKDKPDFEKEIHSSFSYINKWLELYKHSLLAINRNNNIGFNLTKILNCESLIITPCFFEEKLLATIIVGRIDGSYSAFETSSIEQLAALLSFAISNIRTGDLNKALESRLLQAQKLETIGKLSSGMAHDFSNLLSSIFGSVNLLRKRVPKKEDTVRLIDNIEDCSKRARDLTKGLLSFGKPTPKRKELVKPNILLSEMAKVITQTFPGTITFTNQVEENLHDILGNGTEIYQVLLNLCVNAKEATDGKGSITLVAKNITIDEKNIINYPLLKEGNYVCFAVKDNGSGIKEQDLQKIFDPYFSTKSKETGSGLGLYVSYGIIKAHKGLIDVSSKDGEGTQFDVYIPAFEPQREKHVVPSDKIILLADDEEMLIDLLAELLESNEYNVIKVNTGKEALTVLTEEIKVDLVIIDYNMPGMNGLETISEIRKLNLDMPIILSTGTLLSDNKVDIDKYKINGRIQKPYEFETMLATIKKYI